MDFGVTVLPDPPFSRWLELIQLAERHGFGYAWTYDSHVLWQESIPMLAVAARETSKIRLGHFVTNPATRDPTVLASSYATLHDISDGRMVMGVGRGDSAVRFIGRQPMKVAEFERACAMVHEFMNGREVNWNDKELQLKWVRPELPEIPMWVAGYGPKALGVAGRVGDGVIIQLADPEIITWIMDTARRAAEEAGRDPSKLQCIVGAPSHVTDDLADARDQVRWVPAMVSTTATDLIELRALLEMRQATPLSFSPDGKELLVASNLPGSTQLFVLPGMRQVTFDEEAVTGQFLPDGRILVERDAGGNERTQLYVGDEPL